MHLCRFVSFLVYVLLKLTLVCLLLFIIMQILLQQHTFVNILNILTHAFLFRLPSFFIFIFFVIIHFIQFFEPTHHNITLTQKRIFTVYKPLHQLLHFSFTYVCYICTFFIDLTSTYIIFIHFFNFFLFML